jgi:hypothetical protein
MNESWIQVITIIGSNLVIMLTFFGTTVALHMQTNNRIEAIQSEMKDFHGRLCKIEENRTK